MGTTRAISAVAGLFLVCININLQTFRFLLANRENELIQSTACVELFTIFSLERSANNTVKFFIRLFILGQDFLKLCNAVIIDAM